MSNDLISRSALAEEIRSIYVACTGLRAGKGVLLKFAEEYKKSVLKCIEEAPTAYDVDAVCNAMLEVGERYCDSIKCDHECKDCDHGVLMNTLVGIARNGGNK